MHPTKVFVCCYDSGIFLAVILVGLVNGLAHSTADYLSRDFCSQGVSGSDLTIYYLVGGITQFASLFPYLLNEKVPEVPPLDENEWVSQNQGFRHSEGFASGYGSVGSSHINDPEFPILGPEEVALVMSSNQIQRVDSPQGTSPPLNPSSTIMHLRQIQKHLVASVWYGKRVPHGDVPVRIIDRLFLGSSHTSTRELVQKYDIGMILRLGWGFVDHLGPDEVVYESYFSLFLIN
jgi:hypothetical protein